MVIKTGALFLLNISVLSMLPLPITKLFAFKNEGVSKFLKAEKYQAKSPVTWVK